MNNGKFIFERLQPVLLDYTEDDLDDEDLGMSGIVLPSPFDWFIKRGSLKDTFIYMGTIKEDEERCVISWKSMDGEFIRDWLVLKCMIKPHPDYECVCDTWIRKY